MTAHFETNSLIVALEIKDVYLGTVDSLVVPKSKFGDLETKND